MAGPKSQATLVLIAAMLIGVAIGVTGERLRSAGDRPEAGERRGARPGPESGLREGRLPRTFEQLDLTEEQRTEIRATMERYRPLTREVMDEMMPRLRALRDSAKAEIDGILTEAQRARLREMDEDFWDRRWEGRRGGPPRRGVRRDSTTPDNDSVR